MKPRVSLVIPCYNEFRNLLPLFERCKKLVAEADAEVILVDNGSSDETAALLASARFASEPRIRATRVPVNRGYGNGILTGLAEARGEFLGWTHADLQTDPCDVLSALRVLRASGGARDCFLKGSRGGRGALDRAFTTGMSLFERALLGYWMPDINGQPTLFSRDFYRSWRNPPLDFSLDLFAFYAARAAGLEICRFATDFSPRHSGQGHNDLLRSKLRYSWRTIQYSIDLRRTRRSPTRRRPGGPS